MVSPTCHPHRQCYSSGGIFKSCVTQVDVTITAKADQPWLWGLQSAVEAVFIAQAKDDILAFLEYSLRLFKELHRTLQVLLII